MSLDLPTFATITFDPNWGFDNFGAKKHGAARGHYGGSPVEVLSKIPVAQWCRRDSIAFMWCSLTKLEEAIDVWRAWGFRQVTSWPWVKTVPSKAELAKGIGFWAHQPAELLVVLRKGRARGPKQDKSKKVEGLLTGPKSHPVFYSRRGAHSRKPLSLIEWIESRMPGPLLELWATGERPGWTCLGHRTGWHLCELGAIPLEEAKALGLVKGPSREKVVELVRPSVYRIRAA